MHITYIDVQEVQRKLKQIKHGKAVGVDQIPPNLFKDGAETIVPILTYLRIALW